MGDFKADVQISISLCGVKRKADMWINMNEQGEFGMDQRIVDFFREVYGEASENLRASEPHTDEACCSECGK